MVSPDIAHDTFGILVWNDALSSYVTHIAFTDSTVISILIVDCSTENAAANIKAAAVTYQCFLRSEPTIKQATTDALLDNYNQNWSGDDDEDGEVEPDPMGAETFRNHLTLTAITFFDDASAELYYDNGGLFLAHTIVVSANKDGQFERAALAG